MVAYGGAPPVDGLAPDENDEYQEEDEEKEPIASISGMFELCNLLNSCIYKLTAYKALILVGSNMFELPGPLANYSMVQWVF